MKAASQDVHLSVDRLLSRARDATGLSDFGDDWFMRPLAALVEMINREARLTSEDAIGVRKILRGLTDRLRLTDWIKQNPGVLDEQLAVAGVIIGLPRGGSTLTQRLVTASPQLTGPYCYETSSPVPVAGEIPGDPSPRIARCQAMLDEMISVMPNMKSMHPLSPMNHEEEVEFFERGFQSVMYLFHVNLPSYGNWLWQQDHTTVYNDVVLWLKALQYQRPERRQQKWLLKSSEHLLNGGLRTALKTFPDATFIMTHRSMQNVIPSFCSLQQEHRSASTRDLDPTCLGADVVDLFDRGLRHLIEVRKEHPADRFADVQYTDTFERPLDVFHQIMASMGLEVTEEDEKAARAWMAANGRDTHPPHRYTVEQFGITRDELDRRFAFYHERYLHDRA